MESKNIEDELFKMLHSNPNAVSLWIPMVNSFSSVLDAMNISTRQRSVEKILNATVFNVNVYPAISSTENMNAIYDCLRNFCKNNKKYVLCNEELNFALSLFMDTSVTETLEDISFITNYILDLYVPSDFVDDINKYISGIGELPFKKIMEDDITNIMAPIEDDICQSMNGNYYKDTVMKSIKRAISEMKEIYSNTDRAKMVFADLCSMIYEDNVRALSVNKLDVYSEALNNKGILSEEINPLDDVSEMRFIALTGGDKKKETLHSYITSKYKSVLESESRNYAIAYLSKVAETLDTDNQAIAKDVIKEISFGNYAAEAYDYGLEITDDEYDIIMEAIKPKVTLATHKAKTSLSNAYSAYKSREKDVDSQLTKMITHLKRGFIGDQKVELIEGKKFSVISILKTALVSAAIFSWTKIGFIAGLCVRKVLQKKSRRTERVKLRMELEEEIEILEEKIRDASGDIADREAKYALMRTKKQLENALKRLKTGMQADDGSIRAGKDLIERNRERR